LPRSAENAFLGFFYEVIDNINNLFENNNCANEQKKTSSNQYQKKKKYIMMYIEVDRVNVNFIYKLKRVIKFKII
jgi:hypothetical protein